MKIAGRNDIFSSLSIIKAAEDRSLTRYEKSLNFTTFAKLAFLTPCDQAFNPPFSGGKIIELAKFCLMNKRFEPNLSFFNKAVIVSHCV